MSSVIPPIATIGAWINIFNVAIISGPTGHLHQILKMSHTLDLHLYNLRVLNLIVDIPFTFPTLNPIILFLKRLAKEAIISSS